MRIVGLLTRAELVVDRIQWDRCAPIGCVGILIREHKAEFRGLGLLFEDHPEFLIQLTEFAEMAYADFMRRA